MAVSFVLLAVCMLTFGPATSWVKGDPSQTAPAFQLGKLGMKFNGAGSCKGSGCHDKEGADFLKKKADQKLKARIEKEGIIIGESYQSDKDTNWYWYIGTDA